MCSFLFRKYFMWLFFEHLPTWQIVYKKSVVYIPLIGKDFAVVEIILPYVFHVFFSFYIYTV